MGTINNALGFNLTDNDPLTVSPFDADESLNAQNPPPGTGFMITETGIPMEDETATYNMITDNAFPFNGNDPYAPPYNTSISNMRVDLSISRDGGYTFGNTISQNLNPTGNRINRMIFQRLGRANDVTFQLQFWGLSEFVVTDGLVELYV